MEKNSIRREEALVGRLSKQFNQGLKESHHLSDRGPM